MEEQQESRAFEFDGNWKEYAPIAFTNLLLTIVTLGIYRFWATARTRRYLWSRTRFIDDRLEWAGTGLELFKGFVLVLLMLGVPYFILNFVVQRLILSGQGTLGAVLGFVMTLAIYYLIGMARFRATRYRLSRTYWRGIRGGSADPGLTYGWSWMWKNFIGTIALGLLIPWSMVSLWNERWNKMSFGPYRFEANGRVEGLMGRFLLCYAAPFLALIGMVVALVPMLLAAGFASSGGDGSDNPLVAALGAAGVVAMLLGFYFIIGFVVMAYYAKFFRQMVDATTLHTLEFGFTASTMDWIKLYLVDVALVVLTLGIGIIFLNYRHWQFMVTHMHAYGQINVDELTQSDLPELHQGEGLLDAFDMGAF